MTALGPVRRCACALVALTVSALLFRGSLSAAVVTRGDDALRGGDVATAVRSYRKALALDPASALAADRLAFQLALVHRPAQAAAAVSVASAALARHPLEPALFADRGFGELQLHAWQNARADFARAGILAHDARYHYLAARLALRIGDRPGARAGSNTRDAGRSGIRSGGAAAAESAMTPLAAEALALGAVAAGWSIAAHAARRRGVGLGKLPVLALAAFTILIALHPPIAAAGAVALGGVAIAAICDARTGLIFTPLTLVLGLATLAAATYDGDPGPAATGMLVVGGALFALHALTNGRGIGLGDVRLGCAVGAGLGGAAGLTALGWAFVLGGAYGSVLLLTRRAHRTTEIRFAPFIAAGTLVVSLGSALR